MFLTFLGQAVQRFGMHWLNGTYAGWFNHRHQRSGHLFQGRFHSFLVERETYLRELLRYVVLNPVRAKMVARPEDYRWSSYRSTAGIEATDTWLDVPTALGLFDDDPTVAQRQYQEFVLAKIESSDRLWDNVINGIYLGTESWAKRMREIVEGRPRSTDHPLSQRAVGRPKMATIVAAVARAAARRAADVVAMRGGPLRRLIAWIGWHEGLTTLRSIAASLRLRSEGHISGMIRRCEREFAKDAVLLEQLDLALVALRA